MRVQDRNKNPIEEGKRKMKAKQGNLISRIFSIAACILSAILLQSTTTQAAGLLIAEGGFGGILEIQEHDVEVTINNGVAITEVTQVFLNKENRQVEALYTFPVPKGASIANFSMWINGKEVIGEVLEKERAREIYNSYKRVRRDPGLLEQVDYKTFEMRIFPIAANAEQRVQIAYYQELDYDHDWGTYVYPLATSTRQAITNQSSGRFALQLNVRSAVPIASMESPSHTDDFVIAKHSANYYQASLELTDGSLEKDVVLAYNTVRPQTGFDLITSKESSEPGFFSLTLTAGEELAKSNQGMDYVFLLDISGSMSNQGKLILSKESIGAFINELGESDRFEVMTFNVQPNLAFKELREASDENKEAGVNYLDRQGARGGTLLNPAITTAYKYANADRPLNVVILSDGLTEQKERQTLLNLIASRPESARVFCIGVGNGVNRPLLEQIARDSDGLAAFISRGDNFERNAKAFQRKLTRPAIQDVKVTIDGVQVTDRVLTSLPNLYHGSPLRIYGRYHKGGTARIQLTGNVSGVAINNTTELEFPDKDINNPEIDRMWAWHQIDNLLKESDRRGKRKSVVDEVIRLGEDFSIVTEYTSFLVLENDAEYRRWKIERKNANRMRRDRSAQSAVRTELASIRERALSDIGPLAAIKPEAKTVNLKPTKSRRVSPQSRNRTQSSNVPMPSNRGDGGGGSGPVGPLFVLFLAGMKWLTRK
jgi:Ca-activated chloride channel family protein